MNQSDQSEFLYSTTQSGSNVSQKFPVKLVFVFRALIMMDQQDNSVSSCEESASLSQLSQLLREENVTHQSHDQIALRKQGSKAASHIWRERVTQWCYDVVDHLRESRSTVYVAMNILDRFLVQCPQSTSDRSYEAAALTALFLAVRVRGSRNLEVVDLVRMSRLGVTIKEIVEVGKDMTRSLSFDRRLLTPTDFVQQLIKYLPSTYNSTEVAEVAGFCTELCTVDSFFAGVKASEIAFASIISSLGPGVSVFIDAINSAPGIHLNPEKASALCSRIKSLRNKTSGMNEPHVIPDDDEEPLCVVPLPSSPVRVVSQQKLCLKRSVSCTTLATLNAESSPRSDNKRAVSPVTESKKRRIV